MNLDSDDRTVVDFCGTYCTHYVFELNTWPVQCQCFPWALHFNHFINQSFHWSIYVAFKECVTISYGIFYLIYYHDRGNSPWYGSTESKCTLPHFLRITIDFVLSFFFYQLAIRVICICFHVFTSRVFVLRDLLLHSLDIWMETGLCRWLTLASVQLIRAVIVWVPLLCSWSLSLSLSHFLSLQDIRGYVRRWYCFVWEVNLKYLSYLNH